jgi:hypothetical protein
MVNAPFYGPSTTMPRVKSPQDLGAALIFILIGVAGLYFGKDLRFGTAARMGPGFFPFYLSWCIIGVGLIVGTRSFMLPGLPVELVRLRPVITVLLSLLVFGYAMELLGLIFSSLALVAIAAYAQDKPNIRDTLLLAAGMAIFCVVVFVWALKQPLTLFGN